DRHRFLDGLALEPFGRQATRRDGAAAAEGLEPRVLDQPRLRVDEDLQFHNVAALGGADDAGPDVGVGAVEAPDVAGIVVVIEHLVAVWHLSTLLGERISRINVPPTARS